MKPIYMTVGQYRTYGNQTYDAAKADLEMMARAGKCRRISQPIVEHRFTSTDKYQVRQHGHELVFAFDDRQAYQAARCWLSERRLSQPYVPDETEAPKG